VRPAAEGDRPSTRSAIIDGPHAEPRQFAARIEPQPLPSLHTAVRRQQILRGLRSGWTLLGTRPALLAAGLAGALLFAATTGFGRNVRPSQSLSLGLDRMLVAAGLGINEIAVSGHRHTLDQDIFRVLGAGRSSLLFFDVGAARQRLEALPWIDSASLIRVLPDKLKVEVRERRPAAAWLDGDRVALVDLTGRLLAYVATFVPPELPRIAGPGAPEAAAELISALARFPEIAARVHVAHRIGQRRWDLELTGGTRILMAAGPSLPSLQRLVELNHETQVLEQANQVVDLTMSRSIAVSDPTPADAAGRRPGARLPPARPL
jgi:cell division protein FtsQ